MSAPDGKAVDPLPQTPKPANADPKAWVAAAVSDAMNDDAVLTEEQDKETMEQLEKLRADMEKEFLAAVQIYKTRFTELPSIQRLREKWKARQIADDDPIFMNMEVHAISDARSQIQLTQVMNIIRAFEEMSRVYVRQVRLAITEIAKARKDTAAYAQALAQAKAEQSALQKAIVQYGRELPELLETMAAMRRLCDSSTFRAKLELAGLGAVFVLVGFLIGRMV